MIRPTIITGIVWLTVMLMLGACATHGASPMPDKQGHYAVDCSGSAQSWGDCYKKAQDNCPYGFDVVSQKSTLEGGMDHNQASAYGSGQTYRTLVVTCRKPAAT